MQNNFIGTGDSIDDFQVDVNDPQQVIKNSRARINNQASPQKAAPGAAGNTTIIDTSNQSNSQQAIDDPLA